MKKKIVVIATGLILAMFLLNYGWVTINLQPLAPTIDQPPAITYVAGTAGHTITWHPSSRIPDYYTIFVKFGDGMMTPMHGLRFNWSGGSICQSIDGFHAGTYYFTCAVYDTLGRSASSTVTVKVLTRPPDYAPLVVLSIIIVAVVTVGALILLRSKKKWKK